MTVLKDITARFERPVSPQLLAIEDKTRVILAGFSKYIGNNIKTNNINRLVIIFNPSSKIDKSLTGVHFHEKDIKIDVFDDLPIDDQKIYLLQVLKESIQEALEINKWNSKIFEGADNFVLSRNFTNKFTSKKVASASGHFTAQVVCLQRFEECEVQLKIEKSKCELIFDICNTSPNEFAFATYLVKPIWITPTEVEIQSGDGPKIVDITESLIKD